MAGKESHRGWMLGLGLVLVAVLVGAIVFFFAPRVIGPALALDTASESPTPTPLPLGGGVPPEQGDSAGKGPVATPAAPQDPGKLAAVTPFITLATLSDDGLSVDVHSFVPGLTESGGTCTAVVVGQPSLTAAGPATVDVSVTNCPTLTIPLPAAPGDTLEVTVSYESAGSSGTSSPSAVVSL